MPGIRISVMLLLCATCPTVPLIAQDRALLDAARGTLDAIQNSSFKANREYCGLLGQNESGQIVATRPRKGRRDSCTPRNFLSDDITPIASYHTHGAYDPDADAEVPSLGDLEADTDEGLAYGFVSSPGGRFWVIDTARAEVRQVCGLGCLKVDPDFVAGDHGQIAARYSARELAERERN